MRSTLVATFAAVLLASPSSPTSAAEFNFFGRSGDGIELDFGSLPGVAPGATFSGLTLDSGFHTALTSSNLNQGTFSSDGRFWVFPSPFLDTPGEGDTDPNARGFQGALTGSVLVNGVPRTFGVTVRPGHTGVGQGSVGQSLESINDPGNNRLFVAQQQHRLRYLGFVREGGLPIVVDGLFGPNTDAALRTFQAAFVGGNNTDQGDVDGIIGPNTAGWLNAGNAPTWDELIDPDPQIPGLFSVGGMIGDFDILPARDPGTGQRTGLTPQTERFGTNWSINLFKQGAAEGKSQHGRTFLMNGMSTNDGYGSSCCHSTHRAGMDIDIHIDVSAWDFGNGFVDTEEQLAVNMMLEMIQEGLEGDPHRGRVQRIIASNADIRGAINAVYPGLVIGDSSGVHQNHFHIDVGRPTQIAGLGNLAGDLNLDGFVDAADYTTYRDGLGKTLTTASLSLWAANFGAGSSTSTSIPEPGAAVLLAVALGVFSVPRSRSLYGVALTGVRCR